MLQKISWVLGCLAIAGLFYGCGPSYRYRDRDDYRYGYRSTQQVYEVGFREGYERGLGDRRYGYGYSYERALRYSRSSYYNTRPYRDGFVRGYDSGYRGRSPYYGRY